MAYAAVAAQQVLRFGAARYLDALAVFDPAGNLLPSLTSHRLRKLQMSLGNHRLHGHLRPLVNSLRNHAVQATLPYLEGRASAIAQAARP
jgi:hypothetical protein